MTAAGTPPGKAWSGRFAEGANPAAEAFTASLSFDRRLWPYDLAGSAAWARALARAKLITEAELESLLAGLDGVRRELEGGTFPFRRELEDIHMNVERRLIEVAGPVGGKLHTGRSRNDQIALDERLYLRDILDHVDAGLVEVERALVAQAERHPEAPMPGYTHLQRAQPVLLAHHLLAYVFMLERDRARFRDGRARVNVMPLGAAALAGAAFAIDREALARDLGFARPAPTAWTRWPIAISCWSSSPTPRSSACTAHGSPRISPCGRRPSSASWSSRTPSRPARPSCRRRRTPTWPS